MHPVYEREVARKLKGMERSGLGRVFELCDSRYGPVLGFRKGKNPKVLLTACHHANEVYSTYHTLLKYAEEGRKDCTIVPVVDVERFCINMDALDRMRKDFDYLSFNYYLRDYILGCNSPGGLKGKVWSYGGEDSPPVIRTLEGLVGSSRHVIDFHNCSGPFYVFISNKYKRKSYKRIKEIVKGSAFGLDYHYLAGFTLEYMDEGLFYHKDSGSILDYAAGKGIFNLAVEVPVVRATPKGFSRFSRKKITDFNMRIIEAFTS